MKLSSPAFRNQNHIEFVGISTLYTLYVIRIYIFIIYTHSFYMYRYTPADLRSLGLVKGNDNLHMLLELYNNTPIHWSSTDGIVFWVDDTPEKWCQLLLEWAGLPPLNSILRFILGEHINYANIELKWHKYIKTCTMYEYHITCMIFSCMTFSSTLSPLTRWCYINQVPMRSMDGWHWPFASSWHVAVFLSVTKTSLKRPYIMQPSAVCALQVSQLVAWCGPGKKCSRGRDGPWK